MLNRLEQPEWRVSGSFRNQLERAALSVSNNIAEGFERMTTRELMGFLSIARGSAGEVRSMIAVVRNRSGVRHCGEFMERVSRLSESCTRQITGWMASIEGGKVQGKRHLDGETKARREMAEKAAAFRRRFLAGLKPDHPLYRTPEAQEAREAEEKTKTPASEMGPGAGDGKSVKGGQ